MDDENLVAGRRCGSATESYKDDQEIGLQISCSEHNPVGVPLRFFRNSIFMHCPSRDVAFTEKGIRLCRVFFLYRRWRA